MGGGSSKQEESQPNHEPTPFQKGSNRNSKNPSPRPQYRESKLRDSKLGNAFHDPPDQANVRNQKEAQSASQNSAQMEVESPISKVGSLFFAKWPLRFQKNDQLKLKVFITVIQPTFQIKNLNKKFSEHDAELFWQYEYRKNGKNTQTLLRFILNEDGGWTQRWLFDEQTNCYQGDETIWSVVCPIRASQQAEKVGGYLCERSYQSSEDQFIEENGQQRIFDAQVFKKWGQKLIQSRSSMKKLLRKRKMIEEMKNQQGFEYSETTRYFTTNGEWAFSVLVEEKQNSFKSWIIQAESEEGSKHRDKATAMSSTLKNDIQTRQTMYIEQMKKKREIIEEAKLSQQ